MALSPLLFALTGVSYIHSPYNPDWCCVPDLQALGSCYIYISVLQARIFLSFVSRPLKELFIYTYLGPSYPLLVESVYIPALWAKLMLSVCLCHQFICMFFYPTLLFIPHQWSIFVLPITPYLFMYACFCKIYIYTPNMQLDFFYMVILCSFA